MRVHPVTMLAGWFILSAFAPRCRVSASSATNRRAGRFAADWGGCPPRLEAVSRSGGGAEPDFRAGRPYLVSRPEAALASLTELGEVAEPALREALTRGPTLEARRRIEPLLEYRRLLVNPSTLGRRRGIHVLEKIGTAAARELLRTLAGGEPEVRSTRDAARALLRLE